MKKCLLTLLSAIFVSSLFPVHNSSFVEAKADAWQETRKTNELTISYGQAVSADSEADYCVSENGKYAYGIRHGDLSSGVIAKFDKVTSTYNSATFVTESDESNKEFANVLHWVMYSSNGDGFSFFFTALEDISFSASDGDYGGYMPNAYVSFFFKDQNSDVFIKLSSKNMTEDDKNAPFDEVNLHAGDTIYWEFISYGNQTGTNRFNVQRNKDTDFYPSFVIGSPSETADYISGQEDTYAAYFGRALSNLQSSGTAITSLGYLDISFNHGTPKSYEEISLYSNSIMLSHASRDLVKFWNNQVQMNSYDDAIIRYKANYNIVLNLIWSTDDSNGIASWGDNSVIRYYIESSEGDLYLVDERAVILNNKGKSGEYNLNATLREDESLLVCMCSDSGARRVINYIPDYTCTIKGYSELNAIDFDSIKELEEYKTTKNNGLHWYFSSASGAYNISVNNVLIEHFTYCVDIESRYQNLISNAENKAQVDTLVTQFKSTLKSVSDAAKFVYSYLHMRDYDIYWDNTSGSDLCKTYYGSAKTAFNALNLASRNVVCEDDRFIEAYERLTNWAEANHDYIDEEYLIRSSSALSIMISENSYVAFVICVSVVFSILIFAYFVFKKKVGRKAK